MEPPDQPPSSVKKPMDAMRWALRSSLAAWLCGVGSIGLAWCQSWWYVFHPHYLPLSLLFVGIALSTCIALACCLWRIVRGPGRMYSAALAIVALIPAGIWANVGYTAHSNFKHRWVPNTFNVRMARVAGATLMLGEATFRYTNRRESERLVMLYRDLDDPEGDLAAMDEHVARMEELLGGKLGEKVYLIHGRVLGQTFTSLHGLAITDRPLITGGYTSPSRFRGARHELAHAALDWFRGPGSDPPNVLHEGWGMAQCGDSSLELAREAEKAKRDDPSIGIRELFGPKWYHQVSGPVYTIGGAFVDFLVRTRGWPNFRRFYVECKPDTVEAKCREIYEINLDELEAEFWEGVAKTRG